MYGEYGVINVHAKATVMVVFMYNTAFGPGGAIGLITLYSVPYIIIDSALLCWPF